MIRGTIACILDEEAALDLGQRGKKLPQYAGDRFVLHELRKLYPDVRVVAAGPKSNALEYLIKLRPAVAVNLAYSALPCEAAFAGALESLGIAYTGSGAVAIGIANDKVRSRQLLAAAGVRVPQFMEVPRRKRLHAIPFAPPYFVKPAYSGNSVGVTAVSRVHTVAAVQRLADRIVRRLDVAAVCDQFITGREFQVGLLEAGRARFRVAGIVELHFARRRAGLGFTTEKVIADGKERRSYGVKYRTASLTPKQASVLSSTAIRAAATLGLRGYAKVDLRMDAEGAVHVIEVNSNPGLWRGEIWKHPSFATTLMSILEAARRRARELTA